MQNQLEKIMEPSCTLNVVIYAGIIVRAGNITLDTNNRYHRIGLQLTEFISQALGCSSKILYPADGEFGRRLQNGTWTGMVGMVHRGEADLAISEIGITEERSGVVDFSYPVSINAVTFISQQLTFSFDITTIMAIFTTEVWTCLVLLHVFMALVFRSLLRERYSFPKIVQETFGAFLCQPVFKRSRVVSERMVIIFWLVFMTIVSSVYRANLLSILSFPHASGVRLIPDLYQEVSNGRYECFSYPGSYFADTLIKSSLRASKTIGSNMKKNGDTLDVEGVLRSSAAKKNAFVGSKPDFVHLKNEFYISEDVFFNEIAAIAINKEFCCKAALDKIVGVIQAGGLYEKILEREQFSSALQSFSESAFKHETDLKALSINEIYSVLYISFLGYIVASACFFLELIIGKKCGKKKQTSFCNNSTANKIVESQSCKR